MTENSEMRHQVEDEDFNPNGCSEKHTDDVTNSCEKKEKIFGSLVYCKLFYFFFNSAMGSLWPYFPLYFRQQFLTPRQVGTIVASRTLLQFLFVPFWCTIAEKFRKHKQLLMLGLFAWLISTLAILSVPREEPKACLKMHKDSNKQSKHPKVLFDFSPFAQRTSLNSLRSIIPSVSSQNQSFINQQNQKSTFKKKDVHMKNFTTIKNISIMKNQSPGSRNTYVTYRDQFSSRYSSRKFPRKQYVIDLLSSRRRNRESKTKHTNPKRIRREHYEGIYDDYYSPSTMFNISTDLATIYAEYDPEKHITDTSRSFILLLTITIVGVSLASPSQTLVDICTMKKLKNKDQTFGSQVVWAAIGSASFAFVVGTFVSFFKSENPCTHQTDINYSPCFYVFAFFMTLTLIIASQFKFEDNRDAGDRKCEIDLDESIANLWECVKTINDIHLASLLVVTFYCGFGNGFISTFLFWHLREMGGLQILLALVSLVNSTAEVIFYSVSEQLMGFIGHFRLIYIGLFCFSARFFYYSFLRQPWLVLPIEITHGMTSAAVRSTIISYIRKEGATGHILHGLFNGIHGGLGFSIGGLVGGFMVHNYGHTITFLIFGELSLLTLFCFILVNNIWPQTKYDLKDTITPKVSNKPKESEKTQKKQTDFKIFSNETIDHSFHNLSTILSNSLLNERSMDLG